MTYSSCLNLKHARGKYVTHLKRGTLTVILDPVPRNTTLTSTSPDSRAYAPRPSRLNQPQGKKLNAAHPKYPQSNDDTPLTLIPLGPTSCHQTHIRN